MTKEQVTKENLKTTIEQLEQELHLIEIERRHIQNIKAGYRKLVTESEQKNQELLSKTRELERKRKRLTEIVKKGTDGIYESRWGFHPCSRTHYMKLKYLRSKFYEALRKQAAWERWTCKEPINRYQILISQNDKRQTVVKRGEPLQEPPRCPVFSCTAPGTTDCFKFTANVHRWRKHPYLAQNTFVMDMGIEKDFLRSHPQEKIEDVMPLEIPEAQLDLWIRELMHREFLDSHQDFQNSNSIPAILRKFVAAPRKAQ